MSTLLESFINFEVLSSSHMAFFGNRKKKKQEAAQRIAAGELTKEQEQVFGEIFSLIVACVGDANKSKEFKTMSDGKIPDEVGDMIYYVATKNKNIIVNLEDKTASRKPLVCQVVVDVSKDKIHCLWGVYGPERDYSINQKEDSKRDIKKHIENFKLFPN